MTDINIDGIVTWLQNWFQDKLVSGTNIKTINNQSILGSGNISISGGGGSASNIFDLDPTSQYGDTALEQGTDNNGEGLGYGNDILIYNGQETKFYYDKNGNADYDSGNELATMNDVPTNSSIVNLIYPVGSIYMSINSTSPQTLFGGTWVQLKDRFLLGSGDSYTNGSTGGSADAVVVQHNHTTGRDYVITTDGSGVSRISTAGQTGTKVNNLLQSADALYRNTVENAGVSGTGKNMPPYLVVNIWKRTA